MEQDNNPEMQQQRHHPAERLQQPKTSELLRNLFHEDDAVVRLRSLISLFKLVVSMAKMKTLQMMHSLRVEERTRQAVKICLQPITALLLAMKKQLDHIQLQCTTKGLPHAKFPRYPEPVKHCTSLDNVYELVNNPSEPAVYKQWELAPIELSKRKKPVVNCKANTAPPAESRSNSRARGNANNNFAGVVPMEYEGDDMTFCADFEDDGLDQLSLPSSTTGLSTLNNDDKGRISHLEAQLALLQSQLNFLIKTQGGQQEGAEVSMPLDRLPSIGSPNTSPEQAKKRVPPPPAPPPPPANLFVKHVKMEPLLNAIKTEPKVQIDPTVAPPKKDNTETRGRSTLQDVLKGIENVQLRKVERSPNGTPMRGAPETWPTFTKNGRNSQLAKDCTQNIAPANSGAFIAMALQKKFANVPLTEMLNETDDYDDQDNSSGWDDDSIGASSLEGPMLQPKF